MDNLQTFQVVPSIPPSLSFLEILSRNMWWCWWQDAIDLFRRIDPRLWLQSGQNPIHFLTLIPQKRFEELAHDDSFLANQSRVKDDFEKLVLTSSDRSKSPFGKDGVIAYLSMEFGIHESLPLFAGGLGILAGDHLKAASNLGIPIVGVGLLFREGYFRQYLDQDGWQQETYPETDIYKLPVERAHDTSGNEVRIQLSVGDETLHACVWKMDIGRIPLYLLDTNVPQNSPEFRYITARLYAGDPKMRLAQEVLLGIGGIRALAAMNIQPIVCHLNEGHCAFAGIERLAQIMDQYKIDLNTAREIIPRTTVFTTHTPVSAGHDEFPVSMVHPYLKSFETKLERNVEKILSWGQPVGIGPDEPVSMFILGLHMAQHCNGVSKLHGAVARRMWSHVWPERPEDEVPINHVTNGVHILSFLSDENTRLFERYLGPEWHRSPWRPELISRIDEIYDEELWQVHEMQRSRLTAYCRLKMSEQYGRRNAPKATMEEVGSVLDQNVLTIAFARRFTPYKRASLLLRDPERLEAIIRSESQPVQFIFAGKAHPKDNEGKEYIRQLIHFAQRFELHKRFIFLEDYDSNIARHLVQGADVWLNTPRRPREACGTSGMKAAINGVLNVSILDGWWSEGYSNKTGWRIGNGEEYDDHNYQDDVESQALYNVLENDIIPCFYDRKEGMAPGKWIEMMKASMKMAMQSFSSQRMAGEYEKRFYLPAAERFHALIANNAQEANTLYKQRKRLKEHWKQICIQKPVRDATGPFRVGDSFDVTVDVFLGKLKPEEVEVEVYFGPLKSLENLAASHTQKMKVNKQIDAGNYQYFCHIICSMAGRYGFTARVTPQGDDWIRFSPGLIAWAS